MCKGAVKVCFKVSSSSSSPPPPSFPGIEMLVYCSYCGEFQSFPDVQSFLN
jgi:hypothetical protein